MHIRTIFVGLLALAASAGMSGCAVGGYSMHTDRAYGYGYDGYGTSDSLTIVTGVATHHYGSPAKVKSRSPWAMHYPHGYGRSHGYFGHRYGVRKPHGTWRHYGGFHKRHYGVRRPGVRPHFFPHLRHRHHGHTSRPWHGRGRHGARGSFGFGIRIR